MIVNWDFYVRRKRLNIKEWLERKNIKDYVGLVEVTEKLGIETPQEEKVSKYFEKPEIKKNDKKIKKSVPKLNIVPDKILEKTETASDFKSQDKKTEKPKQTRARNTRKKRKPYKKEDQ
jgi:hypothetical protein